MLFCCAVNKGALEVLENAAIMFATEKAQSIKQFDGLVCMNRRYPLHFKTRPHLPSKTNRKKNYRNNQSSVGWDAVQKMIVTTSNG